MSSSIIYISAILITTVSSLFNIATNGSYIRKTFYEMTPDVVSSAVFVIYSQGYYNPHFNKVVLQGTVINYFRRSLKGRADTFEIGFTFLKFEDDKYSIDYESYPKYVNIKFKCDYSKFCTFEGTVGFKAGGTYTDESY